MRRLIALSLLLLFSLESIGCYAWKHSSIAPMALPSARPTDSYRITLASGSVVELTNARVHGDSLLGIATSVKVVHGDGQHTPFPIGIPLSQVTRIETRGFDVLTTLSVAAAIPFAVAVVAGMVSLVSGIVTYEPELWPTPKLFCRANSTGACTSSCPLIYSWDGTAWHLDSGTFGGAITPALARTDLDNLLYPRPTLGLLQFRMTDEANETEHVDAFTVLAVDHPVGTEVAPDARANGTFHLISALQAPVTSHDFMDRDILDLVRSPDTLTWESQATGRNPDDPAHLRDGLELTFARPVEPSHLQLVVDAQNTAWASQMMGEMVNAFGRLTSQWYDSATSAAASAPMARAQHGEGFLQVSVWDGAAWRASGEIWEAGPEVAKRQVLPIDVAGIVGDTIRVRLESAPSFWHIDYVGLGPVVNTTVTARELQTVAVTAPRDTNALAHLAARDGRYLDMQRGDVVSIIVRDMARAPAMGMVRSYLARTGGWYRVDGRDNAAPDLAMLAILSTEHGGAKLAVSRMNQALAAAEASRVPPR